MVSPVRAALDSYVCVCVYKMHAYVCLLWRDGRTCFLGYK